MLKQDMTEQQRHYLGVFVELLEAAGWNARHWDELLDKGVPCEPEGHAERETLQASLVCEFDLQREVLTLLILPRGALTPLSLLFRGILEVDRLLERLLANADLLTLEGIPTLIEELELWRELITLSVGTEDVPLRALLDETIDLHELAKSFAIFYDRGLAASDEQDWRTAVREFGEVTRLRPDFAEAWHHLGHALARLGERQSSHEALSCAVEMYRAHAEHNPDDAAYAFYWCACALCSLGEHDRALDSLEQAIGWVTAYKAQARKEEELEPLRDDPRFLLLVS